MEGLNRKDFFKVAGAGSVAAAGAAGVPLARHVISAPKGFTFRARGGLPKAPLPSYATQIVEGSVDLTRGAGVITSRVLAGHPEAESMIGIPGLSRVIRVTGAVTEGQRVRLNGVIEDRSQLKRGESAMVEILVDRRRRVVQAPFLGRTSELQLTSD